DVFYKYRPGGDPQPFYFVHITDPHITDNYFGDDERWKLIIKLTREMDPPPDFVICTGDLVDWGNGWTGELNYGELLAHLWKENDVFYLDSDCTIPIYFCPGNHDARKFYQWIPYSFDNYYAKVY
ncbi:unnamed protein product, partial [marine sediment metagenome]